MEWGELLSGLRCGNVMTELTSEWGICYILLRSGNSYICWKRPLQTDPLSVVPLPLTWEGAILALFSEGVLRWRRVAQVVYEQGAT